MCHGQTETIEPSIRISSWLEVPFLHIWCKLWLNYLFNNFSALKSYSCSDLSGDCFGPEVVDNGQHFPSKAFYHHGEEILFICDAGYELEGDSTIQCVDGQFKKPMPTCVQMTSGKFSLKITVLYFQYHGEFQFVQNVSWNTNSTMFFLLLLWFLSQHPAIHWLFVSSSLPDVNLCYVIGGLCGALVLFFVGGLLAGLHCWRRSALHNSTVHIFLWR